MGFICTMAMSIIVTASFGPCEDLSAAAKKAREKDYHEFLLAYYNQSAGQQLSSSGQQLAWKSYAPRFLEFAERVPEDEVGLDAAEWIIRWDPVGQERHERALSLLEKHHYRCSHRDLFRMLVSPKFFGVGSDRVARILRSIADADRKNKEVTAEASLAVAQFLFNRAELIRLVKAHPGGYLVERLEGWYGAPYVAYLQSCDPVAETASARSCLEEARNRFPEFVSSHSWYGGKARDTTGKDIDGQTLKLADYHDRVVVICFWGQSCPPCREMIPSEKRLVDRLKDKPFNLLGVACDLDEKSARTYVAREGITWKTWWAGGPTQPILEEWDVREFPTVIVIDQHHVIRYRDIRGDELEAAVVSLLEESKLR